jgi:hypothetical protein
MKYVSVHIIDSFDDDLRSVLEANTLYDIIFDPRDYLADIYRSYKRDDAHLRKQIDIDFPRMNIVVDYQEPQTTDDLHEMHPMLSLVCTQASFFIMFHAISAVYSHGDNHVTDINTQGRDDSFIDIEHVGKRAMVTLSRMFGVISPTRFDGKYIFKILAKLYIDIRLHDVPLRRALGKKQTEIGLLSWTIC